MLAYIRRKATKEERSNLLSSAAQTPKSDEGGSPAGPHLQVKAFADPGALAAQDPTDQPFVPSEGLTSQQAAALLQQHGRNELEEHQTPAWLLYLQQLWGPMPIMLWLAIIIEAAIQNWADFAILLVIQFVNATLSWCVCADRQGNEKTTRHNPGMKCCRHATPLLPSRLLFAHPPPSAAMGSGRSSTPGSLCRGTSSCSLLVLQCQQTAWCALLCALLCLWKPIHVNASGQRGSNFR